MAKTTTKSVARKFTLTKITKTKVGRRIEDTYHYSEVGGAKQFVMFYASGAAWEYAGKESEPGLMEKLIEAYTAAGLRQHEIKGGFDAAIKNLSI